MALIVVIVARGSTILADAMLVAITWKFLPSPRVIHDNAWNKPGKYTGLTSIMLYNGAIVFL